MYAAFAHYYPGMGDPRDVPVGLLAAMVEEIPRLHAQQDSRFIAASLYASGNMSKADQRRYKRELDKQIAPPIKIDPVDFFKVWAGVGLPAQEVTPDA